MSSLSWSFSEAESKIRFSVQEANSRGDFQEARETGRGGREGEKAKKDGLYGQLVFISARILRPRGWGIHYSLTVEGCPQGCYLMLPASEGEKQRGTQLMHEVRAVSIARTVHLG